MPYLFWAPMPGPVFVARRGDCHRLPTIRRGNTKEYAQSILRSGKDVELTRREATDAPLFSREVSTLVVVATARSGGIAADIGAPMDLLAHILVTNYGPVAVLQPLRRGDDAQAHESYAVASIAASVGRDHPRENGPPVIRQKPCTPYDSETQSTERGLGHHRECGRGGESIQNI